MGGKKEKDPSRMIVSKSPSTGEILGEVPVTEAGQARSLIAGAREAARKWAGVDFKDRAQFLKNANRYIYEHLDEIVETISAENGKPRAEAQIADLIPAIYHNRYFADSARKLLADHNISMPLWRLIGKGSTVRHAPWGVIGIISPWNYPFGIPMTQITMALMAGNAVVFKPSSSVPLTGRKIKEIWDASGLPEGVFNIIQGPGPLGEILIEEKVDRLIFTGSVQVGRHVGKLAAEKLIPTTLELGGKDPAIVLADANLESATSGVLWGAMTNAGQTCAGIERAYVQRPIFDAFVERIVDKAKKLRVGPDENFDSDVGAITTESQLAIIVRQVEEAKAAGARVLCGGEALTTGKGRFYPPTILVDVDHAMAVMREENFGPLLPIMPFDSVDEAVELANDTPFGLSASVWTSDVKKAREIASRIVAGTVTINDSLYTYGLAETPWGGVKDSGIGRTHGREGLLEMVRTVHIASDRYPKIKKPWWYPYQRELYDSIKNGLRFFACPTCETDDLALFKTIKDLMFRKRI